MAAICEAKSMQMRGGVVQMRAAPLLHPGCEEIVY